MINRRLSVEVLQGQPHSTPGAATSSFFFKLAGVRRFSTGGIQKSAIWLVLVGSILLSQARADKEDKENEKTEYEHRAMCLTTLAYFTVWGEASGSTNADFRVGLFVPDELWSAFEVLKAQPIHGHRVTLLRPNSEDDAKGCQLLYIAASKQSVAQGILSKVKTACILTVGENESFAKELGTVALVRRVTKTTSVLKYDLQFEVNLQAAVQSHLKFNSHFLHDYMKILEGK